MEFLTLDKIIEQDEQRAESGELSIFERRKRINREKIMQKLLPLAVEVLKHSYHVDIAYEGQLPSLPKKIKNKHTDNVLPNIQLRHDNEEINFIAFGKCFSIRVKDVSLQKIEMVLERLIDFLQKINYFERSGFILEDYSNVQKVFERRREVTSLSEHLIYSSQVFERLCSKLSQHPLVESIIFGGHSFMPYVKLKNLEHDPILVYFGYFNPYYNGKKSFVINGNYDNQGLPMLNMIIQEILPEIEADLAKQAAQLSKETEKFKTDKVLGTKRRKELLLDPQLIRRVGIYSLIKSTKDKEVGLTDEEDLLVYDEIFRRGTLTDDFWGPIFLNFIFRKKVSFFQILDKVPSLDFDMLREMRDLFFEDKYRNINYVDQYSENSSYLWPMSQHFYIKKVINFEAENLTEHFDFVMQLLHDSNPEVFSLQLARFIDYLTDEKKNLLSNLNLGRASDFVANNFPERISQSQNWEVFESRVLLPEINAISKLQDSDTLNLPTEQISGISESLKKYIGVIPDKLEHQPELIEKLVDSKYQLLARAIHSFVNKMESTVFQNCVVYQEFEEIPFIGKIMQFLDIFPADKKHFIRKIESVISDWEKTFRGIREVAQSPSLPTPALQHQVKLLGKELLISSGLRDLIIQNLPEFWWKMLEGNSDLGVLEVEDYKSEKFENSSVNDKGALINFLDCLQMRHDRFFNVYGQELLAQDVSITFSRQDMDRVVNLFQTIIEKASPAFISSLYDKSDRLATIFEKIEIVPDDSESQVDQWMVLLETVQSYRAKFSREYDNDKNVLLGILVDFLSRKVSQLQYLGSIGQFGKKLSNIEKGKIGSDLGENFRLLLSDLNRFQEMITTSEGMLNVLDYWHQNPQYFSSENRALILDQLQKIVIDQMIAEKICWLANESSFMEDLRGIEILLIIIEKYPELAEKHSLPRKAKESGNFPSIKTQLTSRAEVPQLAKLFKFYGSEYLNELLSDKDLMEHGGAEFFNYILLNIDSTLNSFVKNNIYPPLLLKAVLSLNKLKHQTIQALSNLGELGLNAKFENLTNDEIDKFLELTMASIDINVLLSEVNNLIATEKGRYFLVQYIKKRREFVSTDYFFLLMDPRNLEALEEILPQIYPSDKSTDILRIFRTSKQLHDKLAGTYFDRSKSFTDKELENAFQLQFSYFGSLRNELAYTVRSFNDLKFSDAQRQMRLAEYANRFLEFFNLEKSPNNFTLLNLEQISFLMNDFVNSLIKHSVLLGMANVRELIRTLRDQYFEKMRATENSVVEDGLMTVVSCLESYWL